ncbi:MAG: peptide chain release factor 2 [Eubacteriales bacterium]|nr:peptide chain release factor 2 [Eubacteriales bacterium]
MVQYEQLSYKLKGVNELIKKLGESLDPDKLGEEVKELHETMAEPDFWNDMERAQRINQRAKNVEDTLRDFRSLESRAADVAALIEMADAEEDLSMLPEIESEIASIADKTEEMNILTLLTGQYDHNNAILTLHAGAGGTEAQDWVSMLYRMYLKWADKKGYATKELDYLEGDEAGIKSVTFQVNGENAYGYLRSEKGVHRLVRISPFDANARRHTSFASLEVMPEIDESIHIEIRSEDLKVDTYRSSGAGGQHINKTESAIRITHMPTGIVVSCQTERSQVQNRETAMKMLKSKLIERAEAENYEKNLELHGELKKIEWGSQIRSYVFQPYTMVKDHRTDYETGNIQSVMDGDLDGFIRAYLQKSVSKDKKA